MVDWCGELSELCELCEDYENENMLDILLLVCYNVYIR